MSNHTCARVTHNAARLSKLFSLLVTALIVLTPLSGALPLARASALAPADGSVAQVSSADFVSFPSPEVEFIMGPQLKSENALNPVPWFDSNAAAKGTEHGEAFPADPPLSAPLAGTVSVTQGSRVVTGTGTRFLTDFSGGGALGYHVLIRDAEGSMRDYILTSVESDTRLTVSVAWRQVSASGRQVSKATADELDAYVNKNYYDQGLVQYSNYYRTGDARFLAYARKITDSWWKLPAFAEGRATVEDSISPRNSSLAGLMMRALDGRPEMWPWITEYVRTQHYLWVERPLNLWYRPLTDGQIAGTEPRQEGGQTVTKPAGFYFGVRDGGYMLLHAANLARVHPDPSVRAELRAKVLDVAVNYYGRLQRLQSNDGGFYFYLDGMEGLTTQPFQEGILGEGLVAVHRLTGDERVRVSILKLAEHFYNRAYNPVGYRAMYYFVGGGWRNEDGSWTSCEAGCGGAANPWPPANAGLVSEARQLNPTAVHVFGYAFAVSGDARFRTWGDEVFDSSFSGTDGYRSLAWGRPKEYDECYRSAGRYLAWRLSAGAPPPPPSPTPTPSATPTPTPTPGATPAPSPTPVQSGMLSGRLLSGSTPLSGRRVLLYGADGVDPIGAASTDAQGRYGFEANAGQRVVIRPEPAAGLAFSPAQYDLTVSGARSDLDFVSGSSPTPTPTPAPTPTPTPGLLTTNITSPIGGAQYNAPANITISASASAASGQTITRVDFYAGTTMIGTDTTAPYSVVWGNVAGGNYVLTTKATEGSGKSATSSGVQVQIKRSSGSVNKAKKNAQTVSNQLDETLTSAASGSTDSTDAANSTTTQLSRVVSDIQTAYNDFLAERGFYAAAGKIDAELQNALNHALLANGSAGGGPSNTVKVNLRAAIDYLELANVHLLHGDVPNPAQVAEFFVRQNYVDFLNREPDEEGLAYWAGEINRCGADAQCRQARRINVSAAFFLSIESQETGVLVHRLYKASYGSAPTLAEFSPDAEEIGRGLIVGAPDWNRKLEQNKSEFYRQWVRRAGFAARYDNLTNAQYVDALVANAGVAVSHEERGSWVAALDAGQPRDYALRRLVEHGDFVRGEYATAFVMMQYMGYLRRDPDAGGFNFWLTKLNEYGGDFNRAEMVRAFIESIEYNDRFRNR